MTAVAGKQIVVTGIIPGESRITAEQRLRDAGAFIAGTVTKNTDLLVTGAKVGKSKTDKAAALGVTVVPWEQIDWSGDGAPAPAAPVSSKTRGLIAKQIAPMLCLDGEIPTGPGWAYEIKWDGYRATATIRDGRVALMSRSGKTDYTEQFPRIAAELATLPDCVIDGEIVVLENGQGGVFGDLHSGKGAASYIVFDAIEVGARDLRSEPLTERRIVRDDILAAPAVGLTLIARSPDFPDGPALLAFCKTHGLEGVVSKRLTSRYEDGSRSGSWIKTKVRLAQEFVVVGYTAGEGRRADTFGALLLAVVGEDGDALVPCGKVGTGWDDAEHDRLYALLAPLACGSDGKGTTWVDAEIVVQVAFQRWTKDAILWHPSYQGQRTDKDAADVRREA